MAIMLELPPDEEQSLRRQAEIAGQEVVDYLREIVQKGVRPRSTPFSSIPLSGEERERLLDEFGEAAPPDAPLLSSDAVSRASIYEGHD